jgi:hypothetical protein
MAANKVFNFGPVALTNTTTTNILNPPTATGGVNGGASSNYIVIKHFRVVNKTAGAVTCSFWKDATGGNTAGKEIIAQGTSIAANNYLDAYGLWRFDAADFLVGGASANTSLSIEGEGEIGVA